MRGIRMSQFVVSKELKLDFLGDGWADAYIKFSSLSFNEMREFAKFGAKLDKENPGDDKNLDATIELLEGHFLSGKAWDGTELIDLEKATLGDLPVEALTKGVQLLAGADQNL
jgi:hypothetical protein